MGNTDIMNQFIINSIRVQLLNEDIVRIEYAKNGKFCYDNTFFIPNKTDYKDDVEYS